MNRSNAAVAGKSQLTLRLRRRDGKYGRLPTSSLEEFDSGVTTEATCDGDDGLGATNAFRVIESSLTDAATEKRAGIVGFSSDESKDVALYLLIRLRGEKILFDGDVKLCASTARA